MPAMPSGGGADSLGGTIKGIGGSSAAGVATTSLRPSGLLGTDTFLQVDVRQATAIEPAEESEDFADRDAPRPSRAEELKTIVYSFEEQRDANHPLAAPVYCLIRRELAWEQAHPAAGNAQRRHTSGSNSAATSDAPGLGRPGGDTLGETDDTLLADETVTAIPEVLAFAIRYYDGASWTEEWDSMARGGLPAAVEITLQLRSHEEPEHELVESSNADSVSSEKLMQIKHPPHRLVIPLITAAPKTFPSSSVAPGSELLNSQLPPDTETNGPLP